MYLLIASLELTNFLQKIMMKYLIFPQNRRHIHTFDFSYLTKTSRILPLNFFERLSWPHQIPCDVITVKSRQNNSTDAYFRSQPHETLII